MIAAALANNRGFNSKFGALDEERVAALEAALAAVGRGAVRGPGPAAGHPEQ